MRMPRGFLCVCAFLCGIGLDAQSTLGTILGEVKDVSGAVITRATLKLRNLDQGTTIAGESSPKGTYEFLNLKPGHYELTVEHAGFSAGRTPAIALDARDTRRADFVLEVAGPAEAVAVTASVSRIETSGGTIADTKSFEQLTRLPLNTRAASDSVFDSIITVPGVQQDQGLHTSIGGGAPWHIEYSVDGIATFDIEFHVVNFNGAGSPESVSELRVTSVNSNAQFGPMGDVTVISKSGTNQVHGSALWYHQNAALDATTYGSVEKQHKVYNTFGASLGGPVYIPHLYNGRNQTFFFVDYEGNRQPQTFLNQLNVPSQALRQGDLTNLPGGAAVDPDTGAPFPGNRIPAGRINPVAMRLFNYYPLPDVAAPGANFNFVSNDRNDVNTNGHDVRIDRWISSKQSVFARWTYRSIHSIDPTSYAPLPSTTTTNPNEGFVFSHTLTPHARLSNETRFGFSLSRYKESFPLRESDVVATLGLTGLNFQSAGNSGGFPLFDFSDGTGFASVGHPRPADTQSRNYQFTDTLSWIRGAHTMRFGSDLRRLGFRTAARAYPNDDFGAYTFASGSFSGNAFADLLLGLREQTTYAVLGPNLNESSTHAALFAQDDWRVRPGLAIEFGLRWEVQPPLQEASGNMTNFDHTSGDVIIPNHTIAPAPGFLATVNGCPSSVSPCTRILTASQAGLPEGLRKTDYRDWNPRFGFAWQPRPGGGTVLRGGIGSYTQTLLGQVGESMTGIHSSDVRTVENIGPNGAPLFELPNILPAPSFLGDVGAFGTEAFKSGNNPTLRDPRSWQWNLTVQRALPGNASLRVSYVGVQTAGMLMLVDFNQVPASTQPFSASRRPFPQWSQLLSVENAGFAHYEGLQVAADRRMHNGLVFQATYILSKDIGDVTSTGRTLFNEVITTPFTDRFNTGYDRGNLSGPRHHRLLVTGLFPLPIGAGRAVGSGWTGVRQAALGGWELSTVTLLETGPYQTPILPTALDQSNTDVRGRAVNVHPDRIGDGNLPDPTPARYYDASAFVPVPKGAGRFGNAGAGILEGPGTIAVAAGLAKTFHISEKLRMRLEGTFTNLPNHPNFFPPNTTLGNPAFGKLKSVQFAENSGNRTGQVGIRLDF